jgi:exopolysaccharide production protein ExoZ
VSASTHLGSLQLLRAVAATSVVYYHLHHAPNFGSFGVDIFFVISGFVIAMVAGNNPSPLTFAINRVARVVPLYWIFTVMVFVVAAVAPGLLNSTTANVGNLIKSLLFIPYFKENGALHPMLAVGWTLNYEMFFYAVVTVALLVRPKRVFVVTAGIVGLAYATGQMLPAETPTGAFFRNTQLLEFLLGMMVYRIKDMALLKRIPPLVTGLMVISAYCAMAFTEVHGITDRFMQFGIPSFVLVLMALQLENFVQRSDSMVVRLGAHLGDASYAIYLSHFYVVEGIRKIIAPRIPFLAPESTTGAVVTLVVALAAGSVSYVLIDKPATRRARIILCRLILPPKDAALH